MVVSDKLIEFINVNPNDPQDFGCKSFKGQGLDGVKVAFIE